MALPQSIRRNPGLSQDILNLVKEVRLGNLDTVVGQVLLDAEDYIIYLEGKEDRLTNIENALNDKAQVAETNPTDVVAVGIIELMKPFAV